VCLNVINEVSNSISRSLALALALCPILALPPSEYSAAPSSHTSLTLPPLSTLSLSVSVSEYIRTVIVSGHVWARFVSGHVQAVYGSIRVRAVFFSGRVQAVFVSGCVRVVINGPALICLPFLSPHTVFPSPTTLSLSPSSPLFFSLLPSVFMSAKRRVVFVCYK